MGGYMKTIFNILVLLSFSAFLISSCGKAIDQEFGVYNQSKTGAVK
jgi:hypothetical protein